MKVITFTEARRSLGAMLDAAARDGAAAVERRDGTRFIVHPAPAASPLDVQGVDTGLSAREIVAYVRAGRRRVKVRAVNQPNKATE